MHFIPRVLLFATSVTIIASVSSDGQTKQGMRNNSDQSSAIDAKGVRHRSREYPHNRQPWVFGDLLVGIGPEYPYADRALHNEGTGVYKLTLDLKTGSVAGVTIVQSTKFKSLDNSAVRALRKWRWKPGKWKEIEIPITFQIVKQLAPPPPGAIRLQHAR